MQVPTGQSRSVESIVDSTQTDTANPRGSLRIRTSGIAWMCEPDYNVICSRQVITSSEPLTKRICKPSTPGHHRAFRCDAPGPMYQPALPEYKFGICCCSCCADPSPVCSSANGADASMFMGQKPAAVSRPVPWMNESHTSCVF